MEGSMFQDWSQRWTAEPMFWAKVKIPVSDRALQQRPQKWLSTTRPKLSEKSSRTASNPAPTVLWALQSFRQTAQISFYHVREFLLVDHSSSLNKVIHTESYCTDVLHLKWQSTGQYPEESDTLMNKYYVQPLIQHCLASFKNQPSWESPSGDELDLEFETKLVKIFHQDFFKTKHMSSSKLSICGNGFVKTFISSLCSYRCSGMFR